MVTGALAGSERAAVRGRGPCSMSWLASGTLDELGLLAGVRLRSSRAGVAATAATENLRDAIIARERWGSRADIAVGSE